MPTKQEMEDLRNRYEKRLERMEAFADHFRAIAERQSIEIRKLQMALNEVSRRTSQMMEKLKSKFGQTTIEEAVRTGPNPPTLSPDQQSETSPAQSPSPSTASVQQSTDEPAQPESEEPPEFPSELH